MDEFWRVNTSMVCSNMKIKTLQPLADYCQEAFELLEKSIEDPTVNIDDIGEHISEMPVSIVTETLGQEEMPSRAPINKEKETA